MLLQSTHALLTWGRSRIFCTPTDEDCEEAGCNLEASMHVGALMGLAVPQEAGRNGGFRRPRYRHTGSHLAELISRLPNVGRSDSELTPDFNVCNLNILCWLVCGQGYVSDELPQNVGSSVRGAAVELRRALRTCCSTHSDRSVVKPL